MFNHLLTWNLFKMKFTAISCLWLQPPFHRLCISHWPSSLLGTQAGNLKSCPWLLHLHNSLASQSRGELWGDCWAWLFSHSLVICTLCNLLVHPLLFSSNNNTIIPLTGPSYQSLYPGQTSTYHQGSCLVEKNEWRIWDPICLNSKSISSSITCGSYVNLAKPCV